MHVVCAASRIFIFIFLRKEKNKEKSDYGTPDEVESLPPRNY